MSVAFIKKDVLEVGGYPDLFLKEDYALWAKMIGKRKSLKTYHVRLLRQGRVSKCIRVEEGTEQEDQS